MLKTTFTGLGVFLSRCQMIQAFAKTVSFIKKQINIPQMFILFSYNTNNNNMYVLEIKET